MVNTFQDTHIEGICSSGIFASNQDTDSSPEDFIFRTGAAATPLFETPIYDDLRVPINSIKLGGVNDPTWTVWNTSFLLLRFADQAVVGNEERVFFSAQLPHTYKQGEDIYAHIHWIGEDDTAGNVRWQLTYTWANISSVFGAGTSIYIDAANSTTLNEHNVDAWAAISGTGKTISSQLIFCLRRNSSHANDTYNSKSAYLIEFDIHYPIDTLGSRQVGTK